MPRKMDQPHKRFLSRFLRRPGTDRPLQTGPVSVSAPDIDDDVNGLLGLTTLHEPQEPTILVADIAFIHSLGEGSRKAWSYSPDPRHYWPRSWLPADDEFSNIRIHAFAYKANWGEHRKSILNIHESAQSLFGALRNHPGIRQTSTRIVLVGHGMGGCVAKKTYTLARQDPTAAHLAGRVHSIFFLATPHRGSNLPAVLENMLRVAWGRKRYVTDLAPNAAALAAINDDFRHVAPDLRLWSFFETLPTRSTGGMSRFVVDRHSASLGYHNEEIAALDADHRHVCKFDTLADPNYIVLRNALITAIDLIKSGAGTEPEFSHAGDGELAGSVLPLLPSLSPVEATSLVRSFLGVRVSVEGDLAALQALKLPGSCEWFTKKPLYTSWQTGTAPGILWLAGKLAVGKSVLAGHVIEQLHSRYAYCSYFIFKQSKSGVAALSDCLRSLAFQMAVQDGLVMKALLLLARDELTWDKTDDLTVWRHLFTRCIFKLPSIARHFWVVDGVDECANFDALFTKRLLADLPKELPLFATSRNLHEVERGLTSLGSSRATLQILSDADTVEDMRLFLTTGLTELGRPENAEDRKRMCEKILDKSSGSFLWARLVLQEFRTVWTEEAMDSVLRGIPAGLSELYSRMVQSIEEDRRKIPLAKSILTWVILACRPFTVEELRCAVKLDTNQTLQNAAKAILDLCGQLVFIDQHDKVHMIHETAREFLLDDTLDLELSVRKKDSHTRLASLLLGYLSATALKPVQSGAQPSLTRARGFAKRTAAASTADTSLLQYASAFFSEHLYRATAADHHLMAALSQFLGASSVLAWIEHIASSGDLTPPSRTAMNLREYLGRRMKYVPPTDRSVQLVNGWVTDVIRLAAKFCSELLTCPSSIHSLIPPLCPSESTISQTFGKDSRASHSPPGLVVKGLPPWSWDDCLIRMDFQKRQTTTTRHGDRFFVIGLSTGQISLYDPDSLQVLRQMKHPERVRILEFSHDDILLASCGAKHLVIWDPKSGTVMHSFPVRSTALAISFLGVDEILSAFQSSELTKVTGEHASISWRDGEGDSYPSLQNIVPNHPPSRAAFLAITPDEVLLAVGYRAHPILIWNALELQLLGTCEPDVTNNGLDDIVFNPNPEIPALVVAFQDGSLCVFDYLTMEMHVRQSDVHAHSVACSPDGRSIIIGSSQGAIEVFELEEAHNGPTISLTTIYRSNHPLDDAIRGVAFSADGLRFVDVRGRQGRLWAPAALVRKSTSELESSRGSSEADAALLLAPKSSGVMLNTLGSAEITSTLIPSADGKFVIAGRSNGDVVLFSTADARQIAVIYQHARGASIVSLAFVEELNRVISADDAARVLVVDLPASISKLGPTLGPIKAPIVLDRRFGGAVASVLANAIGNKVLIHGRNSDELWGIPSGTVFPPGGLAETTDSDLLAPTASPPPRSTSPAPWTSLPGERDKHVAAGTSLRSVFQHPSNPAWFVVVTQDIARIYSWTDFTELTSSGGIRLAKEFAPTASYTPPSPVPTNNSWETATTSYHVGPSFVVELFRPSATSSARLYLWPGAELHPDSTRGVARPSVEPNLDAVCPAVSAVLRVVAPSTVLFLDVKLWVCSVELQSVAAAPPATGPVAFRTSGFGASLAAMTPSASSTTLSSLSSSSPSRFGVRSMPSTALKTSLTPASHARRHFFALSEWRTGHEELRCAVAVPPSTAAPGRGGGAGSRDVVVFAAGHRVVVVQGGLEFAESVVLGSAAVASAGEVRVGDNKGVAGLNHWSVVAGSMHRRTSVW